MTRFRLSLLSLSLLFLSAAALRAQPLPATDLSRLEPPVQEQLHAAKSALAAALNDEQLGDSKRAELLGSTGELFHANGIPEFAKVCYERAAKLAPEEFRWRYLLGIVSEEGGKLEAAEDAFRRALEIRPDDDLARFQLARVLLSLGQLETAESLLESLIDAPRVAAAVHADLGRLAVAGGAPEEAVKHYRAALESQPGATQLYFPLAVALRQLGRMEAARSAAKRADAGRRVRFTDPVVAEMMSEVASSETYSRLAIRSIKSGDLTSAETALRTALELQPENRRARMNLAVVELQQGDLDEAEHLLRQALNEDPGYAHAHFNLAKVLVKQGKAREAEEHFAAAVRHDPANTEFLFGYASLLFSRGEYAEAVKQFTHVVERAPGFTQARYLLTLTLAASGDRGAARATAAAAHALAPERDDVALALVRLTSTLPAATPEQTREAVEIANSLFAAEPTPDNAEALAMALAAHGQFEQAVRVQSQLIDAVRSQPGEGRGLAFLQENLERYRTDRRAAAPWPD